MDSMCIVYMYSIYIYSIYVHNLCIVYMYSLYIYILAEVPGFALGISRTIKYQ